MNEVRYVVRLRNSAQRDLDRLPDDVRDRILNALERLKDDPRPRASLKLEGTKSQFRLRIGKYRALYSIDRAESTVWVCRIAHRKAAYR